MKFFVACAKSLEYLLVDELLALGASKATAATAGVNVEGDAAVAYRCAMFSRLASRVLWPLAEFACENEQDLYQGVHALDWSEHVAPEGTLAVDAHVSGPTLTHERFAAQRVKDAIVDRIRERHGVRPSVDVDAPDLRLNFVLRKGKGLLAVDLGGGALHRRGWRGSQGEAPLKENLAAAVLLRGAWPSVFAAGGALLDPMCGSGTLLIEGALMAADVAPGLLRDLQGASAPPTRWLGFDEAHWRALIDEATQRERVGRAALQSRFYGSDLDPHAIRAARDNAARAGVVEIIDLAVRDVAQLAVMVELRGLAVCNPPYDARLAADPQLYRALGDGFKRAAPGWKASLLCGDPELARATGLRAAKKYQVFNGAIECVLIVCDPVLSPQREIPVDAAAPALSEGAQMVANRVRKNLKASKTWRSREGVTCYRVYDADIPEYAAAVDVYIGDITGELWLHVQEYAAPVEIPEPTTRKRLQELIAGARDAFAAPWERVAVKTRAKGKGGSKYADSGTAKRGEILEVREGAAKLRVNLFDYLDTGLFLDHRPMRLRIAEEARDARFLNLFAYTGAATVHAAVGGAARTTSVDLSATYLQWCSDNLKLNGIVGSRHQLAQADVLPWLLADRGEYDLVFCDPPTFSNSARAGDFDVQKDHVRLLQAAMTRLAYGGVLYFSNNFRRFRFDEAAISAFAICEDISPQTIPADFARNPRIHRAWRLRAR